MERYLTIETTRTYRIPDGMKDEDAQRVLVHPGSGLELVSDEETDRNVWSGDTYKGQ
jgi:hypothetical protein